MIVFEAPLALLLALLSSLVLYLLFLAAVYFLSGTAEAPGEHPPMLKFAVIVPAHNEAAVIPGVLGSIRSVDYPPHLYDAIVVADNCTDATAGIARSGGARCMERNDLVRKGKGYALAHAAGALTEKDYDAFVIIYADSTMSRNFLRAMNSRLISGQKAVQAYYGTPNPESSPLAYFFFVGNFIENNLFCSAKARLGLPVLLRGNGMCFAKEVLVRQPWDSYSIVEDVEYGIKLAGKGIAIHFGGDAQVLARQPESLGQAYIQRVRWASGNAGISRTYAAGLMLKGVSKGDLLAFDTGLSLLALSKPLLLLLSLLALAGSLLYCSAGGGHGKAFALWAASLLAAQAAYLSAGVLKAGLNGRRILYLLSAPLYLAWLVLITLLGLAGYRSDAWLRTKRE